MANSLPQRYNITMETDSPNSRMLALRITPETSFRDLLDFEAEQLYRKDPQ